MFNLELVVTLIWKLVILRWNKDEQYILETHDYAAIAFRISFVSISLFPRLDTIHLRISPPTAFAKGGGTALPTWRYFSVIVP